MVGNAGGLRAVGSAISNCPELHRQDLEMWTGVQTGMA